LVLVFSLPFCLLLPDGDYSVRVDDDLVTLNLTKSQKIEEKLNSLHLHFLITVILKMFVTTSEFNDDLISNVLKGVKLRNTIIHESNLEVSEKDAKNILLSVKKMAGVLMGDIDQFYNESLSA
jgi:hypothetical protein